MGVQQHAQQQRDHRRDHERAALKAKDVAPERCGRRTKRLSCCVLGETDRLGMLKLYTGGSKACRCAAASLQWVWGRSVGSSLRNSIRSRF